MNVCALCGEKIEIDKYFTRKSVCRHCGGDLHICLNCKFYSPTSHNKCLETKAEFQRSRDKANFCDYFQFGKRDTASGSSKGGLSNPSHENAKRKFDELFKK